MQENSIPRQEKPLPLGRLDQSLTDYFKENGIEVPPIEITMLFSEHGAKEDMSWMETFYRDTDIFIPEMSNWTQAGIERYEKVAEGGADAKSIADQFVLNVSRESLNPSKLANIEMMRIIERNPGKRICVIDVPKGTELSGKLSQARIGLDNSSKRYFNNNLSFAEAAAIKVEDIKTFGIAQEERERAMIASLPQRLGELFRKHPELIKKDTLKILIQLGVAHTRVSHILKKRGDVVNRVFKESSTDFRSGGVGVVRSVYLDKSFSEENSKKLFFSEIASLNFLTESFVFLSEPEFRRYLNIIVESFSLQEMDLLYDEMRIDKNKAKKNFERFLRRKDIPVIKTKSEVDECRKWLADKKK